MIQDRMSIPPAGAVKPAGWLREWAEAAAKGYTGHMTDVDEEFTRAWREDFQPREKKLNWWEGTWSFEGGTYWFDGLVRLAYQLDDDELKKLAAERLEPVLKRMNGHSLGFCWWLDRNQESDVKDIQAAPWMANWVAGMFARVLSAWYQVSGDERAADALRYALGDDYWVKIFSSSLTLPSGTYEAWRVTGDDRFVDVLKAFAEKLQTQFAIQGFNVPPVEGLEKNLYLRRKEQNALGLPSRHGVMTNESLNSVFALYRATEDDAYLDALRGWYAFLDKHARQPFGAMVMDEEWGLPGPHRATETCALAAELWTRLNLLAGLGEGCWGDDVERGFFNAAPATVDREWRNHVYMQLPNRDRLKQFERFSVAPEPTTADYELKHMPLCCTAGLNRILPNYVQSMWMTTHDGGVAAALYGPCTFTTKLQIGEFAVTEETAYPFEEDIVLKLTAAPSTEMPLYLRLPGWCKQPEIRLNGDNLAWVADRGFVCIRRCWQAGDTLTLHFPMLPRVDVMTDYDETQKNYAAFSAGPLLFARGFAETDANTPAEETVTPAVTPATALEGVAVSRKTLPKPWNWPLDSPVSLTVKDADGQPLKLVPYGCTKLRHTYLSVKK